MTTGPAGAARTRRPLGRLQVRPHRPERESERPARQGCCRNAGSGPAMTCPGSDILSQVVSSCLAMPAGVPQPDCRRDCSARQAPGAGSGPAVPVRLDQPHGSPAGGAAPWPRPGPRAAHWSRTSPTGTRPRCKSCPASRPGLQKLSIRRTERRGKAGIAPSTGCAGNSSDPLCPQR
jgi:hypothetical protein